MDRTLIASILLAAVSAALQTAAAAPAGLLVDETRYAKPAALIDIGGRRLNLLCAGAGSPTVIFEAQLGEAAWDWMPVHAAVARRTKACVYDRAGIGFSDPGSRPGTVLNAVDDLRTLLTKAQLAGPFVLVGGSYGAMIVRVFAHRHPEQTAGLVLLDGHHEDELERIDAISSGKYRKMMAGGLDDIRRCAAAARAGIAPGSQEHKFCVGAAPGFAGRALAAAHLAQGLSASYWDAMVSEQEGLDTVSADEMRAERRSFGNLPLVSLTRGRSPFDTPGKPQSALSAAVERDNMAMQDDVAHLSSRGTNRVVPGAGHSIHLDKPDAVIEAVFEVLSRL